MAVVESVVKILLQKLGDQLLQEAIFLHGVGDHVKLLGSEFRRMQSFLKDADAKQEGDERVKNWVRDVRDVAYDAEDIIDTFVFKIATLRRRRFVGCSIRRDACIFSELRARHKLGSEIEHIKNKIRTISDSRLTYGIENTGQRAGMSSEGQSLQEWRVTSPYFPEPDFVAFEKDLEALVTRLIDVGEHRRCVVSVVGMGGLRKTTLTKKVYNDTRVQTHFDSCEWISISQEYGVRDLLTQIINRYKRFPEEKLKKMDLFQLRHEISECLEKKRYLMVLDDIWTNQAWDALKDAFPDVNNGSRVMLTTRNKDVALHADARSPFHEPRFLNDEQSWELFCRKAFPGRNGGCPRELEELGRQIMEKCHGLPLAVVVIGGLLSRKEPGEWETVRRSISWQFIEGEDKISHILALSYKDLPYYLKPCFLYLGNYPEDYEFRTEELIQIWVAEGLIQERGELTLEEVGEHYLKELIQRSMVQVAERSSSGGIKRCRIHDLLRDLSISEAKEGMFLEVHHENTNIGPSQSRARRLVILRNNLACLSFSTPHLRSVLMYAKSHAWLRREEEKFLYRGFKLLRVLYLHGLRIENVPGEIGELIHLRYLGCVKTELKSLPSSIGNLPNLQTLFVSSYYNGDFKVPSTIGKMQQLRHLQLKCIDVDIIGRGLEGFRGVIERHPRVERISNLQTLSGVKSGKWMDGFLGNLTDLKKLEICLLTRPDADVLYRSIIYLVCLQSLSVMARGTQRLLVPPLSHLLKLSKLLLGGKLDKLPEPAEFPTNLTKLTLKNSYLKEDPMATLEKLKNLRILRLLDGSYAKAKMACSSQGFPRLESLHLVKLNKLEEWRVEEGAMPSLLHLRIHDCEQMKKLPEGLQHVTTLKKLELWEMFSSLAERLREKRGEDWHKIRHIPSIHILGEVDTELWDTAGQERYRSLIPSYIKDSVAVIVYHDSGCQSFHNTWEWIEEDSDY